MSAKKQKSKKLLPRILKWSGIVLLLLIISLILIPIFFKDQIKDMALNEANKMLKADIGLEDFDLTFFSTFPNMTLILEGVSVTGRDEFDGIKLVDIGSFEATLGFWSVIGGSDIEISSIALNEPNFDVRILEDGTANYDIVKSEEELKEEYPEEEVESTPFNLTLSHYEINNAYIRYDDIPGDMYAELVNLTHIGNGDLSADVIDFETITSMDELTYRMAGVSYFSKTKFDLDMDLLMEFSDDSDKFTLKENQLSLNELTLSFDGFYEMFDGYDEMDLKLNADKTTFKDLLSLVPVFYHTGYESMVTSGSMELDGFAKGRLDDKNMPAFDFKTNISNASINYPDAPASIDNVRINAGANFPGGENLDKLVLNVERFYAAFAGNTIDMDLLMTHPMSDPYLKSKVLANLDFAKLGEVIPLSEDQKFDGLLESDLFIDGRMSALENENYDEFNAEGSLNLMRFHYESEDLSDGVDIDSMLFEFSPKALNLRGLSGKMGKTDFAMNGNIDNYMNYVFEDEKLHGTFNFKSNTFDLDAWMPESSGETASEESTKEEKVETAAEEAVEPIRVPDNIDFEMETFIGDLIYDGMDIKNVTGKVIIRDEAVNLENLSLNMFEGKIGLTGAYSAKKRKNPNIDFSYKLEDIDIKMLADNFSSIEKLAPVAKHARGKISSDFKMKTEVEPDFTPVYNTLNGDGSLFTRSIELVDFKMLDRLSNVMDISQVKDGTFRNLNLNFAFEDGRVHVDPFDIKLGNINTRVQGSTSFEQEIDYTMKMDVPKSAIPKNILELAEKGVAAAQNIPGFKMKELPDVIPVNALITNTVQDPKIKTDFKEQLMELGGDVKGAVKDLIDDKVDQVKDTVKQVVDDKIEEGKEELRKRKEKIINDAQKQADRIVAEAERTAQRTRDEADKRAQQVIDEAGSNPIKKRAAEASADRIRKEGDEAANRIEREAKQRADNIMKEARERADALDD